MLLKMYWIDIEHNKPKKGLNNNNSNNYILQLQLNLGFSFNIANVFMCMIVYVCQGKKEVHKKINKKIFMKKNS